MSEINGATPVCCDRCGAVTARPGWTWSNGAQIPADSGVGNALARIYRYNDLCRKCWSLVCRCAKEAGSKRRKGRE